MFTAILIVIVLAIAIPAQVALLRYEEKKQARENAEWQRIREEWALRERLRREIDRHL